MEVTARVQYLRQSPRKVRLVANAIRGRSAGEALTQLRFLPKRAALPVEKLLKSAIANAKHNFQLDEKNLRVKTILVDAGPSLKRFRARAFGRAAPLHKRTSHISLVLDEVIPSKRKTSLDRKKVEKPEIREISMEEAEKIEVADPKVELARRAPVVRKEPKSAKAGFVRRIFNRKAI